MENEFVPIFNKRDWDKFNEAICRVGIAFKFHNITAEAKEAILKDLRPQWKTGRSVRWLFIQIHSLVIVNLCDKKLKISDYRLSVIPEKEDIKEMKV